MLGALPGALDPLQTKCVGSTLVWQEVQSAAPHNVCTAATSFCGILGGYGSLPSETAFILVFENAIAIVFPM